MLIKIPFYLSAFMFALGIFMVIAYRNYFTKIIAIGIMQTGVLVFFISLGKIFNALPPIFKEGVMSYSNPLVHVLMLTAIVVGLATSSVAIALVYKINQSFGTINED
jgi:multicomponent Na+:H+ antiporter subunit C